MLDCEATEDVIPYEVNSVFQSVRPIARSLNFLLSLLLRFEGIEALICLR